MKDKVLIDGKYCGFLNRGNGGYVCGMIAKHIQGIVQVTLWKPPPVDVTLDVEQNGDTVFLKAGKVIIAEAEPSDIDIDIPSPPTYEEALEASLNSEALAKNPPSPDCFVCGCNRAKNDGLRVFAGSILSRGIVAAPWIPHSSLADKTGKVGSEFLWAVLDCPGAYVFINEGMPVIVLGRLVARIKNHIKPGEKCVVIGWKIGAEGKKLFSGSALFSQSGEVCAIAKATWLPLKEKDVIEKHRDTKEISSDS